MVQVKVRETYDLHTVKDKMTVISIHTPKPDIIKRNYPGLLMQCRAYRPVSADVRVACASVLPLDPKGVGTSENDVSPEDVFNPILYKAMSNKGMSQLEARINMLKANGAPGLTMDIVGSSADVEVDEFTGYNDDFPIYYGLLAQTHDWKHANPQAGLSMSKLHPLVYELVYDVGDQYTVGGDALGSITYGAPDTDDNRIYAHARAILGNAKPMPFINCTSYSLTGVTKERDPKAVSGNAQPGFPMDFSNCEVEVPYFNVVCGCIIVPPSRLHELFYRMVVEWTIEFSSIRPIGEITDWYGLTKIGNGTRYANYDYTSTKKAVTGTDDSILKGDSCMVSANVDINKVM